jgi:hypothetical protein
MRASAPGYISSSMNLYSLAYDQSDMTLLRYIATAFINFFSITQPAPEDEDRAAWFIAIMLLVVLAAVTSAVSIAVHYLRSS